jgi:hypothetical protein
MNIGFLPMVTILKHIILALSEKENKEAHLRSALSRQPKEAYTKVLTGMFEQFRSLRECQCGWTWYISWGCWIQDADTRFQSIKTSQVRTLSF